MEILLTLLSGTFAIVCVIVGWILNSFSKRQDATEKAFADLRTEMQTMRSDMNEFRFNYLERFRVVETNVIITRDLIIEKLVEIDRKLDVHIAKTDREC